MGEIGNAENKISVTTTDNLTTFTLAE